MRVSQALLVGALTAACARNAVDELAPRDRALIDRWLVCIECDAALDSLRALGSRAPALTIDALDIALRKGPAAPSITSAESVLKVSYVRDSMFVARTGQSPIPGRDAYAHERRDRYRIGYQVRGAIGLGWIGTSSAKARLDSAAALPLAAAVLTSVAYARDSLP